MSLKETAVGLTLTTLLALSISTPPVVAQVNNRNYATILNNSPQTASIEGAYTRVTIGSLNSGWTSNRSIDPDGPCRFVVKSQWLYFKGLGTAIYGASDWIETGRVHGAVELNNVTNLPAQTGYCSPVPDTSSANLRGFYDDYYTARGTYTSQGQPNTYDEWPVVNSTLTKTGTHALQTKVIGTNADGTYQWGTYIDGTRVLTHSPWYESRAIAHQIGWEANLASNSKATWSSPNNSDIHQVLINGSFQNWSTGVRRDVTSSPARNNQNWKAQFPNLSNGTPDYTRGEYTHP